MEQLLSFIASHPILVGAFAVVLAALIATEFARMTRRWKELDTTQAILLINRRDPLIIDVSNSTDFANGHILNAEHMPPSRIESGNSQLLKKTDRPVLVYCKNGQVSPQMASRLVKLGFEDVSVLRGGLAQWISDSQPVTRGKTGKSGGAKQVKRGGKQGKRGANQDKRGANQDKRGANQDKRSNRDKSAMHSGKAEPEKTAETPAADAGANSNGE